MWLCACARLYLCGWLIGCACARVRVWLCACARVCLRARLVLRVGLSVCVVECLCVLFAYVCSSCVCVIVCVFVCQVFRVCLRLPVLGWFVDLGWFQLRACQVYVYRLLFVGDCSMLRLLRVLPPVASFEAATCASQCGHTLSQLAARWR